MNTCMTLEVVVFFKGGILCQYKIVLHIIGIQWKLPKYGSIIGSYCTEFNLLVPSPMLSTGWLRVIT